MRKEIASLGMAACAVAAPLGVTADVTVAPVFTDKMILQRGLPVPVWGTAAPGEKVSVSFAGQKRETAADDKGQWMVKLEPLETSKAERELVVKGSTTLTFAGVLVGEVWLCSGQSNMAGKFVKSKGRSIDPKVFEKDLSGFRFIPQNGGWRVLEPRTQAFLSCVAFHFGIRLYDELDIPVGLIIRATSGTPIQSWMTPVDAEAIRKRLDIPADWGDPKKPDRAATEYKAWIDPLVPVAVRGVIWYQGERNAKTFTGWEYRHLLPHLITTWRGLWASRAGTPPRDFPFYYVQVPTQAADGEWPWLRDAMRRTLDTVKNTGMAVFYDHGPSLHPPDKQPAGGRLALWALAKDYGRADLVHCGPLLDAVRVEGGRAVLTFKHVGGGLRSVDGGKELKFFEVAGKDGTYVAAEARIEGETVVVRSARVPEPVYVRYLFRKPAPDAEVSLINAEGLPASSFITDDFKPPREGR